MLAESLHAAAGEGVNDEEDHTDCEEDECNIHCETHDASSAEDESNESDNEECNCKINHSV